MGTSRTAEELTSKIRSAEEAARLSGRQLRPVAQALSSSMLATAATAGLHPGSQIAKKPWRGTYIRSAGDDLAVGYARGAELVDQPTRPHFIRPRGAGSAKNQFRALRKTGQAKASLRRLSALKALGALSGVEQEGAGGGYKGRHGIRIGSGGPIRAYAFVKGTRGKHFFKRAQVPGQAAASKEIRRQQASAVAKAFK